MFYGDHVAGIQKHVEDFKVCDYLGQKGKHLCLHDGEKRGTIGGPNPYGRKAYLDSAYRHVGQNFTYPDPHNHTYPNSHEFRPVDDGESFLEPVYRPIRTDLRPYLGKEDGWLWDACFWEIHVRDGRAKFHWCYLDYYPVWETNLFFTVEGSPNNTSPKAGGGDEGWPWDPLHLNSVDKNAEGDYLVSIRHLDQILKIAGNHNRQGHKPGKTIWRLGGKSNDFDMGSLTFSKQHSVRFMSLSRSEETFSMFDNAWEGTNKPTAKVSAGKIVTVNNISMTAWAASIDYPHPFGQLSESQGNMQILPNHNVIIGWGALPQITEYHANGTVLWHTSFDKDDQRPGWTYRAFKSEWVGHPYWPPRLVAYAPSCKTSRSSPLIAYVSHNGATEVARWRFFTASNPKGPWVAAGTFQKSGFETKAILSGKLNSLLSTFIPHVSVQALDANGYVLSTTQAKTFVPNAATMPDCDADGCRMGFEYAEKYSCADTCLKSNTPAIIVLLLLLTVVECLSYGVHEWAIFYLLDFKKPSSTRDRKITLQKSVRSVTATKEVDHQAW